MEPKLSQDGAFRSSRGKWHSWAQGWARSMITRNMAFYGARGQEKIERPTRLFLSGFARKAGDNREGQNMRRGNSTLVSCRIRQPVEKCHFFSFVSRTSNSMCEDELDLESWNFRITAHKCKLQNTKISLLSLLSCATYLDLFQHLRNF